MTSEGMASVEAEGLQEPGVEEEEWDGGFIRRRKTPLSKALRKKLDASPSITLSRRFQNADHRDYQLWVASGDDDSPYPLIGKSFYDFTIQIRIVVLNVVPRLGRIVRLGSMPFVWYRSTDIRAFAFDVPSIMAFIPFKRIAASE